ncbi:hypothetical protein HDZ31DRAFT_69081 [Schizophyllum fasciatum]
MKTAAAFASVLALVGTAAALESRQDASYPDCEPTTGAFYAPETLTVGEAFPVRLCSSTYFKTSSKTITLAISRDDTNVSGAVILADDLTSKDNKKYDFEATVPQSEVKFDNHTKLIVVEKINDYYVSSSFQLYYADVDVVYPNA